MGWEIKDKGEKRAHELYRIYKWHKTNGLIIRQPCCPKCNSLDHKASDSNKEWAHDPSLSCAILVCQRTGHTSDNCRFRSCQTCHRQGHSANECPRELLCAQCGDEHFTFDCLKNYSQFLRWKCGLQRHAGFQCNARLNPDGSHTYQDCCKLTLLAETVVEGVT